jgi:uncharacterized membrane protein
MRNRGGTLLGALLEPWVIAGILLLIVWTLARMALLSWADLTYVLPVTSVGFVLNAVLGKFLLHEQISDARWVGTLLIMTGAMLAGVTRPGAADKS